MNDKHLEFVKRYAESRYLTEKFMESMTELAADSFEAYESVAEQKIKANVEGSAQGDAACRSTAYKGLSGSLPSRVEGVAGEFTWALIDYKLTKSIKTPRKSSLL